MLVLLHQTGMLGLCGWATFAPEAAAAGLSSVAIDMCGYGGSECDDGEATPPEDQVALAVAHAREELGRREGGAGRRLDGRLPDRRRGRPRRRGGRVGGRVRRRRCGRDARCSTWLPTCRPAGSPAWSPTRPTTTTQQYAAAQALAAATGAEFLDGDSGHGWVLLNDNQGTLRPDGQALIDFASAVQAADGRSAVSRFE